MPRKKNVTLALDEDLLDQARIVAAKRRTSITELIRRSLEDLVSGDQSRKRAREWLATMMSKPAYRVDRTWTREELHERTVR
jgi:hypothetical protein